MTMQTEPEDTSTRRLTCVRMLYVMQDDDGSTWLAVEPDSGNTGGAMSHLIPGDTTETEGDHPDQVTVVVPAQGTRLPQRLQAYRVSAGLLPTGEEPVTG